MAIDDLMERIQCNKKVRVNYPDLLTYLKARL